MHTHHLATIAVIALTSALFAAPVPRTADGKPNLQGIWQASSTAAADLQDHAAGINMLAGRSVVVGGEIPYQPWAAAKKAENFQNRQKADPLEPVLHARRPSDHVSGFPVSDLPDAPGHRHDLRVVAGLSPDPHRRQQASRRHRFLDGRFARPLGGRHAGGGRRQPQRQNLVRHGGGFSQRRAARGGAIPHDRPPTRFSTKRPSRIRKSSRSRGPSASPCTGEPIGTGFSSTSVRRKLEEENGAFTREERTWYPGNGTPPPPITADRCVRAAAPRKLWRTFAGRPTASRTCRGFTNPTPEARTMAWKNAAAQRPHAGRTRRDRRSAGRDPSDAAVGRRGKSRPEPARTRLRRSDGALFPGRCSAVDVCPDVVSDRSNTRLHRLSARAHVLAHCAA